MNIQNILAPIASLIFLLLCNGYFMSFLTVRLNLNSTEYTTIIIGCIHSAYYFGLILGALTLEKLIMIVGHIRAYAAFASILTLTILLQGLLQEPNLWIIIRFFTGICCAALYIAIESWLLAESNENTRGKILAIYMGTFYCSQASGQLFLSVIDSSSNMPFIMAAIFASISVIPVALTFRPSPELHVVPPLHIGSFLKKSKFGFLSCFCAGLIIGAIYSFLPDFAKDNNLSVSAIMFTTIIGGFILQWPIGVLSDIFEKRKILISVSLLSIVPCGLAFYLDTPNILYALCFMLGGLCFVLFPISTSKVCGSVGQENILGATSALLVIFSLGCAIGPAVIATIVYLTNSNYIFIYIGTISLIISLVGIISIFKKPKESTQSKEQTEFVPLATITPIGNEMDPRTTYVEDESEISTTKEETEDGPFNENV